MTKSVHRDPRHPAKAQRPRTPRPIGAAPRRRVPALRANRDSGGLLNRILDTPHLARVIPQLPPETLHRIIQSCGLEDCGEIVALATAGQLAAVFDLDLWRTAPSGGTEHFDADRFGVWLEVLVESGAGVAAQRLAEMDIDLAIAAFAQHTRVFDRAAVSLPARDGEEVPAARTRDNGLVSNVGGFMVVARRTDSWDAIVAVLDALDAEHRDYFHRLMSGCRRLSNSKPEVDGLDHLLTNREQMMFDVAFHREQRREQQGYATPAAARAFLQMSRQLRPGQDPAPSHNPVASAYFQAIDSTAPADARSSSHLPSSSAPPTADDEARAVAAIVDVLLDAGVLTPQLRALLDAPKGQISHLAFIQAHMQTVRDGHDAAYAMRSQELAYLANTLVAGCPIQGRPFTPQEASDAAVAICNLGLQNWPPEWLETDAHRDAPVAGTGTVLPGDFLVGHDLIGVFQVGWAILHAQVCMHAAGRLIQVLTRLRGYDSETQAGLKTLRIEMTRHWKGGSPWRAREALDVLAILDMPAWAALLGLIDECPVMHAGIRASQGSGTRAISASAFEFISENSQIGAIHKFMQALPETLRP